MIVLDASVLIAYLDSTDEHHARATEVLLGAAHQEFGVSPITMAEVLVGPARVHLLGVVEAALGDLGVLTVALTDESPARLATLRTTTRLKLPDCCVLMAAESAGAAVATFDHRLAEAAADLGIDVHGT